MLASGSGASDATSVTRPRIVCVGRVSWANTVCVFNHPHTMKQMMRNCFAMSCQNECLGFRIQCLNEDVTLA